MVTCEGGSFTVANNGTRLNARLSRKLWLEHTAINVVGPTAIASAR